MTPSNLQNQAAKLRKTIDSSDDPLFQRVAFVIESTLRVILEEPEFSRWSSLTKLAEAQTVELKEDIKNVIRTEQN